MQDAVIQLKQLGRMPDSINDNPTNEIVGRYDDLLSMVKTPLTQDEVEVLISLFPESTMYEVEWSLLHLTETYTAPDYRELIAECPSEEWCEVLTIRLDNFEKQNKS